MNRAELLAFIPTKAGCPTYLGGNGFAVPSLRWLQGPFWQVFRARLWDTDKDKWTPRWTCRDFARRYASLAQECWADTVDVGGTIEDSIAVGEMWFLRDVRNNPQEGHAICPVITGEGLKFIDPQTGQLCAVSPTELESRFFVRF